MSKVIPISKTALKLRKERLVQERLNALEISDYGRANELLKKIKELNLKIYYE